MDLPLPVRRRLLAAALAGAALHVLSSSASAQVTEPNGISVPGESELDTETPLSTFFEAEGEAIDAVTSASISPGTFSPRCDFEATLVLSESQASAGLAWYNVPDDPNQTPAQIYELLVPTTETGTVITSADILTSPSYAGGLIGFALTKYTDSSMSATYAIYYSEYQRNMLCSACSMPDHWKMMLVYGSTVFDNTFYLAFEDWEGANQETWHGNDGDFNDKVFRVTGVTCFGGGEPCDTGKLGHCAAGLTECQPGGTLGCRQQIDESPEACDNLDNDCDGAVDDEAPCPDSLVCREGACQPRCSGGEFPCPVHLDCTPEGLCVDPVCIEVTCEVGEVCRGGDCSGACDGVSCPLGQTCQLGRCVDACAGVDCAAPSVCDRGVCVEPCNCRPCAATLSCAPSGRCVDPGCETTSCDAGSVCVAGGCADACKDAVCPGGSDCALGVCSEPIAEGGAPGSGSSDSTTLGLGGTFQLPGAEATSNAAGGASSGGTGEPDPATGATPRTSESAGCACALINHTSKAPLGFGTLVWLLVLWRRCHTPASGSRRSIAV